MSDEKSQSSTQQLNTLKIEKLGLEAQILEIQNRILGIEESYKNVKGATARDNELRARLSADVSEAALQQDRIKIEIAAINVKIEDLLPQARAEGLRSTVSSILDDIVEAVPPLAILISGDDETGFSDLFHGLSGFIRPMPPRN